MKIKSKKKFRSAVAICLIAAIVIGGAYALLSAYDSRTNRFTAGTLSLKLTEEDWRETNAQDLMPLQTVSKNPCVINEDGNIDAWIYASVKVPSTNIDYDSDTAPTAIGADGTALDASVVGEYYDLFSLIGDNRSDSSSYAGVNSDWKLVAYDATHRNETKGYTIYYYAYTAGPLEGYKPIEYVTTEDGGYTEVPAKGVTTSLFDEIQLVNIEQRPNDSDILQQIDVQGYGIQKENIDNVYKGWAVFANQNSTAIENSGLVFCVDGYSTMSGVVVYG